MGPTAVCSTVCPALFSLQGLSLRAAPVGEAAAPRPAAPGAQPAPLGVSFPDAQALLHLRQGALPHGREQGAAGVRHAGPAGPDSAVAP